MKLSKVSRIVKILTTLQSGQSLSADQLAKTFQTSRRTVFRDLNELHAIGIPYHFDHKKDTYTLAPEFFLPPLDLNLQEALSLLMLIHRQAKIAQLPFKTSALIAAMKIENNLPRSIRNYCNTALTHISARPNAQDSRENISDTFSSLEKAVSKSLNVKILYDSFYEKKTIELTLSPLHLMFSRRAWYIIGHSNMHNALRTFKISRIKNCEILEKGFVKEPHFDPDEYLGRAWSMIPEGKLYNIKLLFLPKVAKNVAEVTWHSTQKTTLNPDGSAMMEFRVDGLNEITWWILGYGDQVQILHPPTLKKNILQIAQNIITVNTQPAPAPPQ